MNTTIKSNIMIPFNGKKLFNVLVPIICLFLTSALNAQIIVKGPDCVVAGVEYQYVVEASNKNEKLQVCLTNGTITGNASNCISSTSSIVRVTWKSEVTTASISVTSPNGSVSYDVKVTAVLTAGNILPGSKRQDIQQKKIPGGINCSNASGGSCGSSYQYQWQKSNDRLKWVDLSGENNKDLRFNEPITQTSFFRRRVFDVVSKTEAYSDDAMILVKPEAKTN
jgi:hypothetical protein